MKKSQLERRLKCLRWCEKPVRAIQRHWIVGVLIILLAIVGFRALPFIQADSPLREPVRIATIAAVVYGILFIVSHFITRGIRVKMRKLEQQKATAIRSGGHTPAKVTISSSHMLNPLQRLCAWINLKTLREISDYCFSQNDDSYLRIQWLVPVEQEPDVVLSWPESGQIACNLACRVDNNQTRLRLHMTIAKVEHDSGEQVVVVWEPVLEGNAPRSNADRQKLTLRKNVSQALTRYTELVMPDGTVRMQTEILCVLTWIGGNA